MCSLPILLQNYFYKFEWTIKHSSGTKDSLYVPEWACTFLEETPAEVASDSAWPRVPHVFFVSVILTS